MKGKIIPNKIQFETIIKPKKDKKKKQKRKPYIYII